MERTRGVVGVIVQSARFLVIRRSEHVVAPGQICFPGGGVLPGEDEPAALCRELDEELALCQVEVTRRVWQCVTPREISLSWWLAHLPDDASPRPNPLEVAEFFWENQADLLERSDLLLSNRAFFEACARGEVSLLP